MQNALDIPDALRRCDKFNVASDTQARRIGDETIFLAMVPGNYLSLNESGTVVWEVLVGGGGRRDAGAALADRYSLPLEAAQLDADRVIAEMVKEGILTPSDTPD